MGNEKHLSVLVGYQSSAAILRQKISSQILSVSDFLPFFRKNGKSVENRGKKLLFSGKEICHRIFSLEMSPTWNQVPVRRGLIRVLFSCLWPYYPTSRLIQSFLSERSPFSGIKATAFAVIIRLFGDLPSNRRSPSWASSNESTHAVFLDVPISANWIFHVVDQMCFLISASMNSSDRRAIQFAVAS